ncbi:hypothetical protein ADU76_02465 (plasmid) [Clostridium botulinum]|uniref:hypothetical protein n=1 Tax=Clostridium botulinum TaxID=1491 RepID=UPI00069C77C6|nr:hypothetical protein [Clostridium botulinum]KOA94882.1 hypothetical protein ADU76_02465 [Clostridium botulinum]
MNNVSIVLYIIRMRNLENKKYLNLNKDKGFSLISLLNEYCEDRKLISCDEKLKRAINIEKINIHEVSFHGRLETGSYGYSSNIKDVSSSELIHKKTNGEVEMINLFFQGYVPKDAYKGLLSLERFRGHGCKTVLEDDLNKFLEEKGYKCKLTFHPILPEKVAKQYLIRGQICKMRLVKHSIPEDVADIYKDEYKNGQFGTFEYVFNARKNSKLPIFKNNINKFLNNSIKLSNIIEINGMEYDNIKVEVEIGGKKRTISLGNLSKLSGNIDISNEVEFDIEGHPKYSSILNISTNILDEYIPVIDYQNFEIDGHEIKKEGRINAELVTNG